MAAIRQSDPDLAERIENTDMVRVADPESHVGNFLGGLSKNGVVLLMGVGSGKFVMEVMRKLRPSNFLIVFEADIGVLKYAMTKRDLRKMLNFPNLLFFVEEIGDYSFIHKYQMIMAHEQCLQIEDKSSTELHPELYEEALKRILEEKTFVDVNTGTQISLGKHFMNSIMRNVPKIIESHGINNLFKIFPDCPCIICSSGPSLDKAFEDIRKAKGKVIVISIDTALPLLLAKGVVPDMVVGIDPLPDNKALFKKNRNLLKDVPGIFMAQYTPEVIRTYPGPIYISGMPGNQIYSWLSPFWGDKGMVDCFGGSVSHYATQIAEYMGCNVIALVGQDLCYKKKYHAGNITKILHEGMGLKEPKDQTIDGTETVNQLGEKVYTKTTLCTFKSAFENKIRVSAENLKFYNTTKEGLEIKGAEYMPLKKFVKKYGIDIDCKMAFDSVEQIKVKHMRDTMIDALGNAINVYSTIATTCLKIIRLIHKCKKLREKNKNKKDEIRAIVREIESLRPITRHPITGLISGYYYHIEVYLNRPDMREMDTMRHKWKRLDLQLDRGLNFYGELREGVNMLNGELRKLRRNLIKDETKAKEVTLGKAIDA
jgi:hypothetical protein